MKQQIGDQDYNLPFFTVALEVSEQLNNIKNDEEKKSLMQV